MKIVITSTQAAVIFLPIMGANAAYITTYVIDPLNPNNITDVIFVNPAELTSVWFSISDVLTITALTNIFNTAVIPYIPNIAAWATPIQVTYVT